MFPFQVVAYKLDHLVENEVKSIPRVGNNRDPIWFNGKIASHRKRIWETPLSCDRAFCGTRIKCHK